MTKLQKTSGAAACGLFAAVLLDLTIPLASTAFGAESSEQIRRMEEEISEADSAELSALEIKVAKLLQKNPDDAPANYLMSVLLLKMFTLDPGSYALIRQSTELAAQTYELDRKHDFAIASLANILEISGETSRGLDLIRDAAKQGVPLSWRSKLAKARLLFDGKNGAAVLDVLEDAVKDADFSATLVAPTLITAITSTYQGEDQIRQLVEWRKKCNSLVMDLAVANAKALGLHFDEALAEYTKIISRHPTNGEALLSKGILALTHKKDSGAAIKLFQQAIQHAKFESDRIAAETHLALALIHNKKDSNQAISAAVRAIADAGDRDAVLMTMLAAFRKNHGVQSTLRLLDELYEKVPGLHLAHALKAELLSERLGRHLEAMRDFTNAITLEPGRSEYYNGRGLAWMGMSNLEAALADFETAISTNPADASAQYNIACVQARLGLKVEAISSLAKAFELDDRLLENARSDNDLASLRAEPDFKSLIINGPKVFSVAH